VSPLAVQDGPVLQDGKLAAPGAVGGSATEPAKFSAANDATDKAGAQAISASAWRTDLGK
jgi:hypothetical protein